MYLDSWGYLNVGQHFPTYSLYTLSDILEKNVDLYLLLITRGYHNNTKVRVDYSNGICYIEDLKIEIRWR